MGARDRMALLIKSGKSFSEIGLYTGVHTAAATISMGKTLAVCALYLPPGITISKHSLAEFFEQLPKLFLVLGDLNVHFPAWGDSRRDGRGTMLKEFMAENDRIALNSGEQIFVHSAYHSTSTIDLAVTSPSIVIECFWAAHSDLYRSNHFLIILTFKFYLNGYIHIPSFNFCKADWNRFGELCRLSLDDCVVHTLS
ncbi:RNA-directed DNA polymerase from mobile element jockey [Plakobranchus ocellatus]|uniref:RNA-directed DNA polymerase from mobile element jockey n=1 Tax=Plakobranchus ocellatus TaxID=259542 RepID=A0AAV3YBI2_9GAST|nr:RNA-directed DNA polymerase from mobile element jockey [Plakobranchus ocellatus]